MEELALVRISARIHFQSLFAGALFFLACVSPVHAQRGLEFNELPGEIRAHAAEIRKQCSESNPEMKFQDMQGIGVLDLNGDGSRDLVVDNEGLCDAHIAGANCTNRGCDMLIYKETGKGRWRKIFEEHLYEKFLAIDRETIRLQLMVASIYAGDPRCRPNPKKQYTSGNSCNLIVRYRGNKWDWQLIR
jgi:hypothetical protein